MAGQRPGPDRARGAGPAQSCRRRQSGDGAYVYYQPAAWRLVRLVLDPSADPGAHRAPAGDGGQYGAGGGTQPGAEGGAGYFGAAWTLGLIVSATSAIH